MIFPLISSHSGYDQFVDDKKHLGEFIVDILDKKDQDLKKFRDTVEDATFIYSDGHNGIKTVDCVIKISMRTLYWKYHFAKRNVFYLLIFKAINLNVL